MGTLIPESPRTVCQRCRRPSSVCYCALVPTIPTRTRVVFLQHPRERKVAVGTARMAHLALPNSELHLGVSFEDRREVSRLGEQQDTAVLFPGVGARDVGEFAGHPPKTLVVIDGTWPMAGKVLKQNPSLQRLPRIGFTPRRPGNYRIRKEPAAHCVSTIEAVAEVLGHLEGAPERFDAMLVAFERMVDWQLERREARQGPPRRKLRKPVRAPPLPREVLETPSRLVTFYAEANAYALDSEPHFEPELIQLVAQRPASGERLELMLAPRSPLAPHTSQYVELPEELLRSGESLESTRRRWSEFLRPGDVLGGWGHFARGLLASADFPMPEFLDLRLATARALRQRPGELEQGAARLGAPVEAPWAQGRAGRRLAALSAVARFLLSNQRR